MYSEKSRRISELENSNMNEAEKLKKLELLANEMLQTMNITSEDAT